MEIIKGRYRVKWQYTHHLNSRSSVERIKCGEYYGKLKHTYKHWTKNNARQMASVHFDGNKKSSIVPFDELIEIKENEIK